MAAPYNERTAFIIGFMLTHIGRIGDVGSFLLLKMFVVGVFVVGCFVVEGVRPVVEDVCC